ncbi:ankyrin repeat domain-containing protein [Campylobacter lari]|uniref:Ankyrin repeat domain-containing protein n=1 Tax=Campylobacter lari TaxID=201 RepID=A0A825SKT3_CAMLA|nr:MULTISPECIES: hypothetical protein [Campylobacter]EAH5177875.1 hypothetical protein [Campylobacter lari]EAH6262259.1 hypothetical protein [Campylobacter lari]EAI1583187.1 hypothetical protein [Campylobacter lari]EAI3913123.1 ankyrin repeat domain-containing protein [Campylobacter lari]EAI4812867.1 ankyrin repeat domain-containing protein [Campylobacter lari]
MSRIQNNLKQGYTRDFIRAICNGNNDVVLEYLKNGMSATKECMGEQPMFYAINHNNFGAILLLLKYGAILEKDYLEYEVKSNKEALDFLASLLK